MTAKRTHHPFHIYETIMNAPDVLSSWMHDEDARETIERVSEKIMCLQPHHIFITGTGSSYMASIAQSWAFNHIAHIPSTASVRSELMTYTPVHFTGNSVLILNTHSGKSPGDVEMIKFAHKRGAYTIGITDIPDSPFAKVVQDLIIGQEGPKYEMPSTRTYSSAIFRVLLLAVSCARRMVSAYSAREYEEKIRRIPDIMRAFLHAFDKQAQDIVGQLIEQKAFFIIGSGPNMSTAYEGAMGLTQGTGMPTAGYIVDEYMHGPIQSLTQGMCVVSIAAPGPFQRRIGKFTSTARNLGAKTIILAPEGSDVLTEGDIGIALPGGVPEVFTPVYYCAPFWLLGYYFSLEKKLDPDNLSMGKEIFKNSGLAELKREIY